MAINTTTYSIKNEIKDTISLSLPLVASYLIYASSGFVGTALVARLGKEALAASVLVSTIWSSLSVLFFGILNAVSILVSHQHGAKNTQAISEIMNQAYLLGAILCVFLVLVMCGLPLLLCCSAQPPAVLHIAIQYMHALLWTIPGLLTLIISEGFLAGIGRAKVIMRISLLVVPIEIPLIYILVFGKFGLPACGVAGVGYGFAVTYTVTAISLVLFLLKSKHYKKYHVLSSTVLFPRFYKTMRVNYLKELVRVGLPIGFMNFIEVSTFALTTFWIARFGTTVLAAHQIVMQYLGFIITLVFSMSGAVAIRVGHAVGRADRVGVTYAAYVGMALNFCCVLLISALLWICPEYILQLDLNIHDTINSGLVHDSVMLFAICGVLLLFDNFRIIGSGALRGLKDTKFTMYASLLSFWLVGLPAAYVFAFYLHWQGRGIWWGLTAAIAVGAVIILIRLTQLLRHIDLSKLNVS